MKTVIRLASISQRMDENRAIVILIKNNNVAEEVDLLQLFQDKNLLHKLPPKQIDAVCCMAMFIIQENSRREIEAFKAQNRQHQQ